MWWEDTIEDNFSYEVFISHASEDKEKLVRNIANRLAQEHVSVWYDEHELKPGDSLRKSIDLGLSRSKFGIVVLSPSFFGKHWPEWELNGIVQNQNSSSTTRIIPIWHNVNHGDVLSYSPSIADIFSIKTSLGIDYVIDQIMKIVKPQGTSIGYARKRLTELGYEPPPSTDEWWLDVIEYDGSDSNAYDWAFSVGLLPEEPEGRGQLIVDKAIQRKWQEVVVEQNISQTTKPAKLLDVMNSIPGLFDLLIQTLSFTICYAPQLTIPGFGGPFEPYIEERYGADKVQYKTRSKSKGGTRLTCEDQSPSCSEEFALRDPNFGYYKPSRVTCNFVQGELMGPSPRVYDHFEYLIWLLSDDAVWLPHRTRDYLIRGFLDWNVWPWYDIPQCRRSDMTPTEYTGSLAEEMHLAADVDASVQLSDKAVRDIRERITWSVSILEINDKVETLVERFMGGEYIKNCVHKFRSQRTK